MTSRLRSASRPVAALIALALLLAPLVAGPAPAHAGPPPPAHPIGFVTESAGSTAPAVQPGARPVALRYEPHEQLLPLRAEQAWRRATGTGVVVAVLDSGVDADHPDLAGRVLPGHDFVDGSTDGRTDPVGHGTTVASLIAGAGTPVTGLAPEATILPVRVLDEQNRYEYAATVADAVRWAVDQGADVINLSLGGPRESAPLAEALGYAMANDVVVVACTGNVATLGDTPGRMWYPAREPGVIAVAGLTLTAGELVSWPQSLTGPETVLAAPAIVTGAQAGGGHRRVQGTSFSSALVAGAAALIRDRWPDLPAADVVHRLIITADDQAIEGGFEGRHPRYGFGLVNPVAALTESVPAVSSNPIDTKPRTGRSGLGTAPDQPRARVTTPAPTPVEVGDGQSAGGELATGSSGAVPRPRYGCC